jgi:dTDP-4-amino-4,6-dideoxygalactose transaminase
MKSLDRPWALFGSAPAFAQPLHVGRPNLGDRKYFMERVEGILDSRWLTNNGVCVQELESQLASYLGVRHCLTVCNATVGLELATRALGLTGEVIVPSMTFIATAHALQWQEIRPVFCDIEPDSHNIDAALIESLITPRTTGIVGVHLWGLACNTQAIEDIASRRGLKVMYDAAHALGCSANGQKIGNFGACEVFSFHATKFFNSFEGGAIATNDDALAERIKLMRNFGFAGFDRVVYIGTNGKMSEVCAAMGLASMRTMGDVLATNRRHHAHYADRLSRLPGVSVLAYPEEEEASNFQYVVVEYEPVDGAITRDDLIRLLWAENAIVRKYFYPGCHRMEPYKTLDPHAGARLPRTESVANKLLILPTGTGISSQEVNALCDLIERALHEGAALARRVASFEVKAS